PSRIHSFPTRRSSDLQKLRQALLAATDHQKLLDLAYMGRGAPGEDHAVAPIHPEYFALPMVKQDYEKAKALLAEAGYPGGIQLSDWKSTRLNFSHVKS